MSTEKHLWSEIEEVLEYRSTEAQRQASLAAQEAFEAREKANENLRVQTELSSIVRADLLDLAKLLIAEKVQPNINLDVMGSVRQKHYYGYLRFLHVGASEVWDYPVVVATNPVWILEQNKVYGDITSYGREVVRQECVGLVGTGLSQSGELVAWEYKRARRKPEQLKVYGDSDFIPLSAIISETSQNHVITDWHNKIVNWGVNILSARGDPPVSH